MAGFMPLLKSHDQIFRWGWSMNQLVFQVGKSNLEASRTSTNCWVCWSVGLIWGNWYNFSIHVVYKATWSLATWEPQLVENAFKNGFKLMICLDASGCITKWPFTTSLRRHWNDGWIVRGLIHKWPQVSGVFTLVSYHYAPEILG